LTLSPLKSVSTLWAVAAPAVAAAIERAHRAAVNGALTLIEQQALFTRTGPQGIRQVDVCGLVRRRGHSASSSPRLFCDVTVDNQRLRRQGCHQPRKVLGAVHDCLLSLQEQLCHFRAQSQLDD